MGLTPFPKVLDDFRAGKMIILVDALARENEGDLTIATETLTPDAVSFMMREARGLICISLGTADAERLNLPLQTLNNNSPFNTPFTISVNHRTAMNEGVTAAARCFTMRALVDDHSSAADFISPGHVFPLVANPAGVIGRQGQTEGSYDLARIAGFKPSGVICEILGADGRVLRGDALRAFASDHNLSITSIEEIIRYRVQQEILVREVGHSTRDTEFGKFETHIFEDDVDGKEHLALVHGDLRKIRAEPILVRIHSECLTGDLFGSWRCDCGEQLSYSMKRVAAEDGIILYLQQEGRGIGLGNKLRAYALQDQGHDTFEANVKLGFAPDERDFAIAAKILGSFGIDRVRLLTNNPDKVSELQRFGINVTERLPVVVAPNEFSRAYLKTKREKFGHWL